MDSTPVSWPRFNLWVDLASLVGCGVFLLGHNFVLSLDTLQVFQGRLSPQSSVGTFGVDFRVGRRSEIICSHPQCTEAEKGLDRGRAVGQGQTSRPSALGCCQPSFLPLFSAHITDLSHPCFSSIVLSLSYIDVSCFTQQISSFKYCFVKKVFYTHYIVF